MLHPAGEVTRKLRVLLRAVAYILIVTRLCFLWQHCVLPWCDPTMQIAVTCEPLIKQKRSKFEYPGAI